MEAFTIGGDLEVQRLGFGAMRITGKGIWGPPEDPEECKRSSSMAALAWARLTNDPAES